MSRLLAVLAAVVISASVGAAYAEPPPPVPAEVGRLGEAMAAVDAGAYDQAIAIAEPVATAEGGAAIRVQDRAEAWRILGLARFFLKQYEGAEEAFVEYLKLDVEGRLDPSLVPPEAIVFFADVRSRHAAELRAYRPKPKRYWMLNLLPPAGQWQNRQRKKAIALGAAEAALVATQISTYLILTRWCSEKTDECTSNRMPDGEPRNDTARVLRSVNIASGFLLVGVLAYGVIDGFQQYRRDDAAVSVAITPTGQIVFQGRF